MASLVNRERSLPEVAGSIKTAGAKTSWKRLLAFGGPAFLVSVGYMDPGNWGTDLAGGSKYGYTLLWVILLSNLMAQLLQVLCARLGLVTGKDLAQACRDTYRKPAAFALWILAEIAIIACDLAEVLGSAVALNLLFGLDLKWGVLITGADVLLLLTLMNYGFRKIEAVIVTLVGTIGLCFAYQMWIAQPDVGGILAGMVTPKIPNSDALVISLGILGATVMPHNLYLHSAVVQTREVKDLKQSIKYNTIDTIVALSLAFFVNAAILILAAAVFHKSGIVVDDLGQGHELLKGALSGASATAFAIALLCSGQSSTITGTLAGQVIMEGFLKIKVKPWIRRLITRGLAIIPALAVVSMTGGGKTVELLLISQVILSMQLSFAIFPLVMITSNKKAMGEYVNGPFLKYGGYLCCFLIAGLNIYGLKAIANEQTGRSEASGFGWLLVGAMAAIVGGFALWVRYGYKPAAKLPPTEAA